MWFVSRRQDQAGDCFTPTQWDISFVFVACECVTDAKAKLRRNKDANTLVTLLEMGDKIGKLICFPYIEVNVDEYICLEPFNLQWVHMS